MTTRLFGERVERREDARLLTGGGRYTDDFEHDALQVAFVRSEFAHARIREIDVSGALDVAGVYAVFTHEDLDGNFVEPLPLLIPHEDLIAPRTQYALAKDEVRYAGEILAMVVARDRYLAEDAAGTIVVDYEPLPVIADLETAAQPGPVIAHSDMGDSVAGRVSEEKGDVEKALQAAPHVFEWRFEIERSAAMPMEGRAVVARYDETDDQLLVHDSTQAPTSIRAGLAMLFGIDFEKVQVVAPDVGGGFGVKVMQFYPEEVLIPWAARKLSTVVKWTEDRREHFVGSNHERRQIHHVRVGCDDDGRILGFETRFLHDTGAYCPYGLIVPIITAAQLPGPYKLENYRYEFHAIFTNTVPTSPYRGAGRPQAVYVMERTIERVARELELDSCEVRRRNFISPDEFPYDVGVTFQDGGPTVYDSGDYARGFEMLLETIGYAGFEDERRRAAEDGRLLGIGVGCYVEGTGIGPYEGGVVTVSPDGTVTAATGLSTQGQSHETVFAPVAQNSKVARVAVHLDDRGVHSGAEHAGLRAIEGRRPQPRLGPLGQRLSLFRVDLAGHSCGLDGVSAVRVAQGVGHERDLPQGQAWLRRARHVNEAIFELDVLGGCFQRPGGDCCRAVAHIAGRFCQRRFQRSPPTDWRTCRRRNRCGGHKYYPENWTNRTEVDETIYFIRHPGPTREFATWLLDRGVRWLAVDVGSADHPMNTVIRKLRPDEAEDAEAKLGHSLDEIFPKQDYQIMHTLLFPHDVIHIENLGGAIDEVLDQRITFGCFPWRFQGGEAAMCRAVAFLD